MEDVHVKYEGDLFLTGLALLFVALKLCGVIHWSWLWVLSPLWIPFGLIVVFILIILVCKIIKKHLTKAGTDVIINTERTKERRYKK